MEKTFIELTPKGKKIKVKRFYYALDNTWLCFNCYHVGKDEIIATLPCENCAKGITQISNENYGKPK